MVQYIHDMLADNLLDLVEVFDHAARGPIGLNRAANGNVQLVGMSVQAGTFARMVWENVSRFKAEVLANLHVEIATAFAMTREESVGCSNQP